MNTFAENSIVLDGLLDLRMCAVRLSSQDYLIQKAVLDGCVSIEIDRQFDGVELQTFERGGKRYGACEAHGCRLYWEIPAEIPA